MRLPKWETSSSLLNVSGKISMIIFRIPNPIWSWQSSRKSQKTDATFFAGTLKIPLVYHLFFGTNSIKQIFTTAKKIFNLGPSRPVQGSCLWWKSYWHRSCQYLLRPLPNRLHFLSGSSPQNRKGKVPAIWKKRPPFLRQPNPKPFMILKAKLWEKSFKTFHLVLETTHVFHGCLVMSNRCWI